VKKIPPFAMTREETSSVHGDDEIDGDALAVTAGGMRLHKRYVRVKPSTIDSGSSSSAEGAGTAGKKIDNGLNSGI